MQHQYSSGSARAVETNRLRTTSSISPSRSSSEAHDHVYRIRKRSQSDAYRETKSMRKQIDTSLESQHDRHRNSYYSSDDSMVYVKRNATEERDCNPSTSRHVAKGSTAALGAAELFRHHRYKTGEPKPGTAV